MEAEGQTKLACHFPQRVPMRVADQGQTIILRFASEQYAFMTHRGASAYFFYRRGDVPERDRGDRQQPARVGRRPLSLPVVVDLHTGEHQLGVTQLQELLRTKSAH